MDDELKYGRRLSDAEYEARLVALHGGLPADLSADADADVRRRELELVVDHRLGTEFPHDRREALWAAHERLEKRRLWLVARHALHRLFSRGVELAEERVARDVFDEYAAVLSAPELEAFLGVADRQAAILPIGRSHFRDR